MGLLFLAFVTVVGMTALAGGSRAQNYPWCAYYGGGEWGENCGSRPTNNVGRRRAAWLAPASAICNTFRRWDPIGQARRRNDTGDRRRHGCQKKRLSGKVLLA
jgi:hypothetical protein